MLTKVEVYRSDNSVLELPIADGNISSGAIQIQGIDGLEPADASVNTVGFASFDGGIFTGTSVGVRNIVMSMGLNPDWAIQTLTSLRHQLYTYFMPKSLIKLRFFSDELPTVEISGYVESMSPNIFSKDPVIQISIICPQPDFVSVDPTVINGNVGITSNLETTIVNYVGTIPTGYVIKIDPTSARPIYNGEFDIVNGTELFKFTGSVALASSKYIEWSSIKFQKYIREVISPDFTSILNQVEVANWLELTSGNNEIYISANSQQPNGVTGEPEDPTGLIYTLTYYARFGGL